MLSTIRAVLKRILQRIIGLFSTILNFCYFLGRAQINIVVCYVSYTYKHHSNLLAQNRVSNNTMLGASHYYLQQGMIDGAAYSFCYMQSYPERVT